MSQRTRMLGDRYEVEATIGRGGMAEVFRGRDRVLGRTVAIKVLAEQFSRDTTFVTRFRREAQSAAGLNHPNIVAVYDTGSDDGRHYIVMEYVEGRTLADVLAEEGPLPPERVGEIGGTIAAALGAAHDRGMVHRDVKPANVMLTDAGQVKVMDFGIARIPTDDTLTQTGMVLGTAAYLSPEQAQGLPAEPASDVYSLGCVLYEMLAGQPPFAGDSPVALAYKHVREYPVPPSRKGDDVPRELEAVVMRALSKEPGERYADGRELQAALAGTGTAAATTEPVEGRRGDTAVLAPGPEPAAPPERRRRWLVPAVLGAILVALIIVGLVALANQQEPARQGRAGQGQDAPAQEAEEAPPEAPGPPDIVATSSVEEAIAQVESVLNQGIDAGTVSPGAAEDIGARVQEAAQHYVNGEMDEALGKIGEAHGKVDEFRNKGEITSGEWAEAIHESLDVVASAMQANPIAPPEEEDEGEGDEDEGGGPGNSEGRGQGQGQGNGKGNNKD